MKFEQTGIDGAWTIELSRFADERGWFQEWFKLSRFSDEIGVDFNPVQANISKSRAGTIRGIHYSIAPEGQGKLVTVMAGAINDYIIDIRVGSPTYGQWRCVQLDDSSPRAVLLDPHLGHAFQALSNNTVVSYLVSQEYNPAMELGLTPTCDEIAISWSIEFPALISEKDQQSPGLSLQRNRGLLPKKS